MRITKIIYNRSGHKSTPKNLKEIMDKEQTPGTQTYTEFQMLYNPNRMETYPGHPNNFDHEN